MSIWPGSPELFIYLCPHGFPKSTAFCFSRKGWWSSLSSPRFPIATLSFACLFSTSPFPLSAQQLYFLGMSRDGWARSGTHPPAMWLRGTRKSVKICASGKDGQLPTLEELGKSRRESSGHSLPVGTRDASGRTWQVRCTLLGGSEGERWETESTWCSCTSVHLLCLPGYFF